MYNHTEEWRLIPGFEKSHQISSYQRVRSLDRIRHIPKRIGCVAHTRIDTSRILKPDIDRDGYVTVTLCRHNCTPIKKKVHRLMLEAFVGPCPPGMQCRHLNGDRADNCLENLIWGTPKENQADRITHGTHARGSCSTRATITEAKALLIIDRLIAGVTCHKIAEDIGCSSAIVQQIGAGITWRHLTGGALANRCLPGNPTLCAADVFAIRQLLTCGARACDLANVYSVGRSIISDIKHRHCWKHLPNLQV